MGCIFMQPSPILSCTHHHCIIGVEKFLQIFLASLGSTRIFHIVSTWMNHEVCIHILLLVAYGQAGDPITGAGLLFTAYY